MTKRRWLQPVCPPKEQWVAIKISKPFQRVADGRLRETHFASDSRCLAMSHGPKEHQQDRGIDQPEINLIYITHRMISLFCISPSV